MRKHGDRNTDLRRREDGTLKKYNNIVRRNEYNWECRHTEEGTIKAQSTRDTTECEDKKTKRKGHRDKTDTGEKFKGNKQKQGIRN